MEVKEKARAASHRHTAGTRASKVPGREREDGGDVLAVLGWLASVASLYEADCTMALEADRPQSDASFGQVDFCGWREGGGDGSNYNMM